MFRTTMPWRFWSLLIAVSLLATIGGCSNADSNQKINDNGNLLSGPSGNLVRDTWDVFYMQGAKIGHVHTQTQLVKDAGAVTIRTESTEVLSLSRGSELVESRTKMQTDQTADGQLLAFESSTEMGPTPVISRGKVANDQQQLTIQSSTAGQAPQMTKVSWQSEYLGFFGVEESLLLKPMQPGETREFKALLPVFHVVGDVKLVAHDHENTELLNGSEKLLRIVCSMQTPSAGTIESTIWTNPQGEPLKSEQMLGIVAYRATKTLAQAAGNTSTADLNANFMVKVGSIPDPSECERVVYELTLKDADPSLIFHEGPQQSVKKLDDRRIQLTVYNGNLAEAHPDAPQDQKPPTPADREPTASVQSDDPRIVKMAEGIAVGINNPAMVCLELEQFTLNTINKKTYSQAFATASEVAKSLEGDCTEHAVLLAALARAKGIPARVAFGMVYVPHDEAFEYHMWTEVFVGQRWAALDGTTGGAGIHPGYIRLTHSSLKEGNGMEGFVAVAQVLGRLKIKVLEQHPAVAAE